VEPSLCDARTLLEPRKQANFREAFRVTEKSVRSRVAFSRFVEFHPTGVE
jgi:hypothetical protein